MFTWKNSALSYLLALPLLAHAQAPLLSPDKTLRVQVQSTAGQVFYDVTRAGQPVLVHSRLGLVRDDADFTKGLRLAGFSAVHRVTDRYILLTAKRQPASYTANEQVIRLKNTNGKSVNIIFRASNDGVAFRYEFPDASGSVRMVKEEVTSFHLPAGTRTWLQPKQDAAYEMHYLPDQPVGQASPSAKGWVFPALFRTGDTWVLLTEADLGRTYCGSVLRAAAPDGDYRIGFPGADEAFPGGEVLPHSTLPWRTPWRIAAIGSLKTIAESTLGTDLAAPAVPMPMGFIKPGAAAWSWALCMDNSINYDTQCQYIDYAAGMHWPYVLVDVDWDTRIGEDKLRELIAYGKSKNVRLLLWYNSGGSWVSLAYHPKNRLLTHADREREFAHLQALGVAGVKIDFFGGDGQSFMNYYQDILQDAAAHELLVNFHGATLPRGWQRTYPNLLSTEAVRGFEMVYGQGTQADADREAEHCTILPFTRNAFDPMDFTPMSLAPFTHPNHRVRKTTNAFELALTVVFLSGIQHYAEGPEGMAQQPESVRQLLRQLPAAWDEVRFLAGFPGKYFVVARRAGTRWYVAGLNAEATAKTLQLDLSFLAKGQSLTLLGDGPSQYAFSPAQHLTLPASLQTSVTMQPGGGFVLRSE